MSHIIRDKVPTESWTKKRMIEWPERNDTSYPSKALKSEIFSIIQRLGITPQYVVDEIAQPAGVHLPVANCTLNPIELAWAQVKGHIKVNTNQFILTEVESLAWEGFDVVTPEQWAAAIKHVRDKVEDNYWDIDGLAEHYTEHYSVWEFTFHIHDDPNE